MYELCDKIQSSRNKLAEVNQVFSDGKDFPRMTGIKKTLLSFIMKICTCCK